MTLRWPSSGSSEKMWACPRRREKSARKKCRNGSYDIFAVALAFIEDGRHWLWCVVFLIENPHFLDVLERTSRRINSPQMTSQPAASCSTSSSRPFQTPVEEFRSLFRTGTASSTRRPVECHCHSCHFCIFSARFFPDALGMLTSFRWNRWTVNAAS